MIKRAHILMLSYFYLNCKIKDEYKINCSNYEAENTLKYVNSEHYNNYIYNLMLKDLAKYIKDNKLTFKYTNTEILLYEDNLLVNTFINTLEDKAMDIMYVTIVSNY